MEVGFVPEYTRNRVAHPFWVSGELETGVLGQLKKEGHDFRRIVTWRCTSCGLLRSYAEETIDAPGWFGPS
jgi:hypothetical protein